MHGTVQYIPTLKPCSKKTNAVVRQLESLTKLKIYNDTFRKNSQGQQWQCTPLFAPAEVLFFLRGNFSRNSRIAVISHSANAVLFVQPASSFSMHAELSGGRGHNPFLTPYRSFHHPSIILLCLHGFPHSGRPPLP